MPEHSRKSAIVVCGPTASGKSEAADHISFTLNLPTILIDSMQVYREIPEITNQQRSREAHLRAIVSIEDEWNVALHKEAAEKIIDEHAYRGFVADAGTGMYLNAVLMDISLSPKAPQHLRERAASEIRNEQVKNHRRELRKKELELMGEDKGGSIWNGNLLYDTTILYIRPSMETLRRRISIRSQKIVKKGGQEAETILEKGLIPNASVRYSIGLAEMLRVSTGDLSPQNAAEIIEQRTRKLARAQRKWFDKLIQTLDGRAEKISVVDSPSQANDIINSWNSAERYW